MMLSSCTITKNGQIKLKLPGQQPRTNTNTPKAVNPSGTRYTDYVFSNTIYTKETFAYNVPTFDGKVRDIGIEIFAPQGDNEKNRPCVMFMFGGGWAARLNEGVNDFMKSFAQKGYVAIAIDYRIGFPNSDGVFLCTANTDKDMREAMFRATQDAMSAIRYVKANADRLGVDKNHIFVGGGSAGGANALNTVFLDEKDVPFSISTKVGKLNSVGANQEQDIKLAGVFSFAGPVVQMDMLENKNTPVLLMQGQCDELIPFEKGVAFPFCKTNPNYMTVMGHDNIYKNLVQLKNPVKFVVMCNGGHDAFGWGKEKLVKEVSSFMVNVLNGKFVTERVTMKPDKVACPNQNFTECGN
jgi:pimeloyl-ACP methyl ester carboxylesterase